MRLRLVFGFSSLAFLSQVTCSSDEEEPAGDSSATGGSESGGSSSGGMEQGGSGPAPESGGSDPGAGGGSETGGVTNEGGMGGQGGASCVDSLPLRQTPPLTLEETGFYSDPEAKTIAPSLREFAPRFVLWSDGAVKTRWVYLPECDPVIDTSEMDDWEFPVGTYSFKRFVVDGELVETRLIHKYGPEDEDVLYATYVWDPDQGISMLDNNGHSHPRSGGGTYEVPNVAAGHCSRCHGPSRTMSVGQSHGMPSRFLGLNAVDLNHSDDGLNLTQLVSEELLTDPPETAFDVPGDPTTVAAIGYLHANCGYCHNDTPLAQLVGTDYHLRLKSTNMTVGETGVYQTAVNVPVALYNSLETEPCSHRIYGGDVELSCIHERMGLRGANQMPPLDTNLEDAAGLDVVAAWIATLSPPD